MNSIRCWLLLPLLLAATSCGRKEANVAHAISGKYIPIVEGVTAVGGDLDGVFSFIIIPTKVGQPLLGRQTFGGFGYQWNGLIRFQNRKPLDFEVKCDRSARDGTVVIGGGTFDLKKGEIFFVESDWGVRQILGSKAGKKDDPDNAKRLAEIYSKETREQAGASNGDKRPN